MKMVGYTPSSFADMVFTGKRIEVGLKRGKFDHPALTNKRPRANREDEKEEGTHVVTVIPTWPNFPLAEQYQHSANIIPSHYPPPTSNTPTSFTDLDFASKKIEVDRKRGKFNHPAWTNEKTGANEKVRMKEKPMLRLPFLHGNFPPAKQCHYSVNNTLLLTHHPFIHKGHP